MTLAVMRLKACRSTLRGYPGSQLTGVTHGLEGVPASRLYGGGCGAVLQVPVEVVPMPTDLGSHDRGKARGR